MSIASGARCKEYVSIQNCNLYIHLEMKDSTFFCMYTHIFMAAFP
jgi:hypothetical protein